MSIVFFQWLCWLWTVAQSRGLPAIVLCKETPLPRPLSCGFLHGCVVRLPLFPCVFPGFHLCNLFSTPPFQITVFTQAQVYNPVVPCTTLAGEIFLPETLANFSHSEQTIARKTGGWGSIVWIKGSFKWQWHSRKRRRNTRRLCAFALRPQFCQPSLCKSPDRAGEEGKFILNILHHLCQSAWRILCWMDNKSRFPTFLTFKSLLLLGIGDNDPASL